MPNSEEKAILDSSQDIPILHVRGSYFAVGFRIGRAFKSMITDLLETWSYFNDELLPKYQEPKGQEIYTNSLNLCNKKFPHYVQEIKGMAQGANIDFYKLFLLNIDSMITSEDEGTSRNGHTAETGCTTVICNKDEIVIGHTEDAVTEIVNNIYVICAEIVNESGDTELERFTSLCYAGHLPGYTLGYNFQGTVYTVNTLFPAVNIKGTPRAFIARALLGITSLKQAVNLIKDEGTGISDGFSLNLCLPHKKFYGFYEIFNIEVSPPTPDSPTQSKLDITEIKRGDSHVHANKYMRMKVVEHDFPLACSTVRHETVDKHHTNINGLNDVKLLLSDRSDEDYPIYMCNKTDTLFIKTVAVGFFDLNRHTLSIYTSPPAHSHPLAVLKMDIQVNQERRVSIN